VVVAVVHTMLHGLTTLRLALRNQLLLVLVVPLALLGRQVRLVAHLLLVPLLLTVVVAVQQMAA
jgi:hypothetical protein